MRSSFGNTLRHLSDGTRLYGREHQGQGLAIFLLCHTCRWSFRFCATVFGLNPASG
ncbi:hypothetical protein GA0061084_0614 [Arthrobacter sp. NIO-1057]|nr:hypothetical protein GA0061084_0614 [Arthrobacter sp. NIO-1057]